MEKTPAFVLGECTCPPNIFLSFLRKSFDSDSPLGLMSDLDSPH